MREIKFRGKWIHGGQWITGWYLKNELGKAQIISDEDFSAYHLVGPETVSQYTGLKDKNGNEIYEGDILRERPNAIFQVVWDEKWAKFKLLCIGHYEYPEWNRGEQMAVIGNIHDNPELLK
jgi:YopX protein.